MTFLLLIQPKKSPDHRLSVKPAEAQFLLLVWKSSQRASGTALLYSSKSWVYLNPIMSDCRTPNKPLPMVFPYHPKTHQLVKLKGPAFLYPTHPKQVVVPYQPNNVSFLTSMSFKKRFELKLPTRHSTQIETNLHSHGFTVRGGIKKNRLFFSSS